MFSCFHSVGLPERSLLDATSLVADAGYASIELNAETLPWAKAHITPQTNGAERRAVVDACRTRGLTIPAVGAHINMVSEDPAERTAAISYVNGCADIASDLASPFIHILSGPVPGNIERGEAWGWFRRAVEETTAYAEHRGVGLGIEAIVGHLFHSVDDYHRIRRELPGLPFKVNFDPSHLEVQGENPQRVTDELGDQIAHVHLKDGKGLFPNFEFPPLGRGSINFIKLVEGLRKVGYRGALSVEYEAQVFGYRDTETQILRAGKAFCDLLQRVD